MIFLSITFFLSLFGACGQTANPDSSPGTSDSVDRKSLLSFHLVDEDAWKRLLGYLAGNPGFKPMQNEDGTFSFPKELYTDGTVFLGSYTKNDSGAEELLTYIPIKNEPVLSGMSVQDAVVRADPQSQEPGIVLTLGEFTDHDGKMVHGRDIMKKITEDNRGKFIAIIFDHKLVSYARINDVIESGIIRITGNFTLSEAQRIVLIVKGEN